MSRRKRQKKRKVKSRKNKQPAVAPKTDSIPQQPKTTVEEKAQSNPTPKEPTTKDVIKDPKSTSENIDSAKSLLDGEPDDAQFGEVGNMPTDEKPSLVKAANESKGNGWLKTKKFGRYVITTIEVLAAAFVIPTAFVLIVDLEDRQSQRIAQAWGLVTQQAPGNSGKIQALEYLNSDDCDDNLTYEPSRWQMVKHCSWLSLIVAPKRTVNLYGVDLSEDTHGSEVFLYRVDLSGGLLGSAKFSGANLVLANLNDAYLEGADFRGARMQSVNLMEATLYDADFSDTIVFSGKLNNAYMGKANFTNAVISGIYMSGVRARGANFTGAYLRGSNMAHANLSEADLRGADISHVEMKSTIFDEAIFSSNTPYKFVMDRKTLMGREYDLFPWPVDAKSGAAYRLGLEPNIREDLLAHFTEFDDELCTWAPRLVYVECLTFRR